MYCIFMIWSEDNRLDLKQVHTFYEKLVLNRLPGFFYPGFLNLSFHSSVIHNILMQDYVIAAGPHSEQIFQRDAIRSSGHSMNVFA